MDKKREPKTEKRSDEKKEINFGSQIRSYVLRPTAWSRTIAPVRVGDTDRVLDGALDAFVEAYLKSAADGSRARASS